MVSDENPPPHSGQTPVGLEDVVGRVMTLFRPESVMDCLGNGASTKVVFVQDMLASPWKCAGDLETKHTHALLSKVSE